MVLRGGFGFSGVLFVRLLRVAHETGHDERHVGVDRVGLRKGRTLCFAFVWLW